MGKKAKLQYKTHGKHGYQGRYASRGSRGLSKIHKGMHNVARIENIENTAQHKNSEDIFSGRARNEKQLNKG